jgi:hypothetical protein
MITKSEIRFWEKHSKNRHLIREIRADRERAIKFFGAIAVMTENEKLLHKVLDARQITQRDEVDLLEEMNRIPEKNLSASNGFTDEEVKIFSNRFVFESKDIKALKQKAQHFLSSI